MNTNVISPWLYRFSLVWVGLALSIPGLPADTPAQGVNDPHPSSILHPHVEVQDVKSLDVYVDHATLHVLIAGRVPGEPTLVLRYLRSDDSGRTWLVPLEIDSRVAPPGRVMRGNDVQIAAAGDRLVAVWHTTGTGYMGSGSLATAISKDGGKTWRPGSNPADDQRQDGHSYIDIKADPQETFHLVWLDNREGREGVQGLRYARSTDGGENWSANATVDGDTCTCCWNTLATSSEGAVHILYRDAFPRDMALA
ncbi:MAG: sialidase family protein, partial [bacterium]